MSGPETQAARICSGNNLADICLHDCKAYQYPAPPSGVAAAGPRHACPCPSRPLSLARSTRRNAIAFDRQRVVGIAAIVVLNELPVGKDAYLKFVEDNYRSDAYHSLSIEGYSVSPELIERVRAGNWDTDKHDADRQSRDALAARGYW